MNKKMKLLLPLPCKKVCPVVAELRFDIENRDREIERLERKVALLQSNKRENEKRLAKVRQAAFGIVDWGIED